MTDLHARLDALAGPSRPATPEQVTADLARGRRALRRRRTVAGSAAGVFAVAAVAAVLAHGTASRPAVSPIAAPASPAVVTELVAYHGSQPKGYTIDKVPAGWQIQGVDDFVLTIAPDDATDHDPHVFVGKIAVMLQSADDHTGMPAKGTAMRIAGKPGMLITPDDSPQGRDLYVHEPTGINLIIQIWDAKGWTDSAIGEFAAGIHVLPSAQPGRG